MPNKSQNATLISDNLHESVEKIAANHGTFINKIQVNPYNQIRVSLGTFSDENPPRGFSVELTPDPEPADSFSTEVVSTSNIGRYRLMMHLANHGSKVITATIYQL